MQRIDSTGQPVGVDEANAIIRGVIVAEAMQFKTGRGAFDTQSLAAILRLMQAMPEGLKCRFHHPINHDGLGYFIGRFKNPRIDGDRVRADLHIDPSSYETPSGNLGGYLLLLAKNDPGSFGTSLELAADELPQLDARGAPATDEDGRRLPPVWMPTELVACDCVGDGDATTSLLGTAYRPKTPAEKIIRATYRLKQLAAKRQRSELELRLRWRWKQQQCEAAE